VFLRKKSVESMAAYLSEIPPFRERRRLGGSLLMDAGETPNAAYFLRPQGAFGVRQLAAAFDSGPIGLFFKRPLESGSEQPHISERLRLQKLCGIRRDGGIPRKKAKG
jgi:hypothetical protein